MKTKLLTISLFIFLCFFSITNISAQLLLKESFEYTSGTALELQPTWDWMSAQATSPIMIESGAYSYTDYPAGVNKVVVGASGEDLYRTFPKQSTGSVYYSFLVQVTAATTGGDYFIAFSTNPIDKTIYHGRIYVKKDESNKLAFGVTRVASAKIGYTGLDYDMNTTYLIVLKYEIVANGSNDVCSMTVNPVIANGESGATWLTTTTSDTSAEGTGLIGAIALRQAAPAVKVSSLRVATSWAALMDASATVQGLVLSTDDGLKSGFTATTSSPSTDKTFKISGTNLSAGVVFTQIGTTKYFELSIDNDTYQNEITLNPTDGSLAETTVYLRMKSNATAGTFSNTFHITSSGVNTTYLKASGDVTVSTGYQQNPIEPLITAKNGIITVYGLNSGDRIEVITAAGQKLCSIITMQSTCDINVKSKGINIVRIGNKCSKVVL